jgi:hypothetical protein
VEHANEADYYRRRHQQERSLAERADKPEARTVHSKLADEYAKRLRSAGPDGVRPKLSIISTG